MERSTLHSGHLNLPKYVLLVLIYGRGWEDPIAKVRPEGLRQWKILVTTSEIEPATFGLVGLCLNQLRHRVPRNEYVGLGN